ncbi:hypothetical protein HDR58_04130 [bacterium]|nr:hypothetical protein [bacterium]
MQKILNKLIDIIIAKPKSAISVLLLILFLIFKVIPANNQHVSHIICHQNSCEIKEFANEDGKGLREIESLTLELSGVAPFFVTERKLHGWSFLFYITSSTSSGRKTSDAYEYTVGYEDNIQNIKYPLFKTYTSKRKLAEDAATFLNTAYLERRDIDFVFKP